jgi:hypothetical protein
MKIDLFKNTFDLYDVDRIYDGLVYNPRITDIDIRNIKGTPKKFKDLFDEMSSNSLKRKIMH